MIWSAVVIFHLIATSTATLKLGAENFNNNWVPINVTQKSNENKTVPETIDAIWEQVKQTQNVDLARQNAIRVVTPPMQSQKRIPFYFSSRNDNEDIDFARLTNKQDFLESAKTSTREEPPQLPLTEKTLIREVLETNAEPGKLKYSEITHPDYIEIDEIPKFVNSSVSEKNHITEFPLGMNITTSQYEIETFNPTEGPEKNSFGNQQRMSKQIDSPEFVDEIMNSGLIKEAESSTYLVSVKKKDVSTEPTTVTTEAREATTNVAKGYLYKQPIVTPLALAASRNALTAKLLENLAKYNINLNDVLYNYDESKARFINYDNTFKKTFHPQINSVISIPFRYNSLNHLPVNPLLAAFLSNYGFYLGGAFGRPNDYRNLYGYSASNNIHNNKPFGSYKVSSDTDSNY